MAKPKQPAIPAVPNDVTPAMRGFLSAMREVLQVQSGQGRGDDLDKAVTFRDLGVTSASGSGTAMLGRVINGLIANGEVVAQSAVERPTTPTGVSVTTYIGGIMVSWDNPRYNGHAYTEVFAQPTAVDAQNQPIDAPALNTETMLLGTAGSPLLGVQARTLLGYYVWVRHVNTLGQVGPVHAALGSYVYLPPSPSYLLEQLTNEITRDQLSIELQEPIDLVPVLETAITTEQTTRANADTALSNSIGTVSAVANAKNKTYYQTAAPSSGMTAGDLWFDTDDNNKTYRYSGSAWVLAADARIATNAAAIVAEQTARADAVSALASDITTVQAYVNGDISNLFLNPAFDTVEHGFNGYGTVRLNGYAYMPANCPSANCLELNARDTYGKRVKVSPGDVFHVSMTCATTNSGSPTLGIGFRTYDKAGTGLGWPLVATRTAADALGTWKTISGNYTVPSGVAEIQLFVQLNYSTPYDKWWMITNVQFTNANATRPVTASVQTNATAIANLDGTYTAQWSAKTQVGDLVGGFGTFNDGTTTRFTVHANRFAIMDSSLGNQRFVPFVVDNGKTVISDAFIRNAYIEQLAAGQITAAKINSLTLNAVNITGGTLSLGSGNNMSFQEGGSAGFGKGGPYGGWGYGWHTIIYADGGIHTDRIYASGGSFTGTVNANAGTFNNVTINSNCDVKGTVYADKIVGDVVAMKSYTLTAVSATTGNSKTATIVTVQIASAPFARYALFMPIPKTNVVGISIYRNGVNIGGAQTSDHTAYVPAIYLSANATHTISLSAQCTSTSNAVAGGYTVAGVPSVSIGVFLTKDGSASFTN